MISIKTHTAALHITLKGRGVSPNISLSVRDGLLDMGAVIAGEYREETFQVLPLEGTISIIPTKQL